MKAKFAILGIGVLGIAAIGAAAVLNVDLLPPRPQEQVVEAEAKDIAFEKADEIAQSECADSNCFEKYYQDMVQNQTIEAAFVDLKVRYDNNVVVRALCHPLVHVIGRTAAQKYSDVAERHIQKGITFAGLGITTA